MQRVSITLKPDIIGRWVHIRVADLSKMGYISFDDLRCGLPFYQEKIIEREMSGLKACMKVFDLKNQKKKFLNRDRNFIPGISDIKRIKRRFGRSAKAFNCDASS